MENNIFVPQLYIAQCANIMRRADSREDRMDALTELAVTLLTEDCEVIERDMLWYGFRNQFDLYTYAKSRQDRISAVDGLRSDAQRYPFDQV